MTKPNASQTGQVAPIIIENKHQMKSKTDSLVLGATCLIISAVHMTHIGTYKRMKPRMLRKSITPLSAACFDSQHSWGDDMVAARAELVLVFFVGG